MLGFQVQALTPYSNHCPITLKLASRNRDIINNNASQNPQRKAASPQNSFTKFLWKSESKDKFISAFSSIDIQDKLQSFNTVQHSSIDDEISQFNQIYSNQLQNVALYHHVKRVNIPRNTNHGMITPADN